uniref:Uncharacterized protein n=1 Tax=Heliothis virescens TaxID=7102 RepID=A0A2A4JCY0_HELVI
MIDHAENSAYETAGAEIPKSSCWMTLNAPHLFKVMDEIDDRYQSVRTDIHEALMATDFDEDMIKGLVRSRGSALREVHVFKQRMIPSGLNLGGYCMLRMPESVLFFHRMKLRNNTYFRIESLHNDFANMQVRIDLCLNDLHLKGAYERSLTDDNPSVLFYAPTFGEVEKYDKEKATALEEYTDKAVNAIVTRIRLLNADTIRVPAFTFKSIHGVEIKLYDGYLRGLDSMYRRSVATGVKLKDIRKVDTVVGFSNLKVVYKYEAILPTGVPPLAGVLTLSANELSAHLALGLVKEPEAVDLDIEFLDQMKPESLTVEEPANTIDSKLQAPAGNMRSWP